MCFQGKRNLNVMMVCVFIGFAIISYCVFDTSSLLHAEPTVGLRVKPSLRLVALISRHGNRGPLYTFPNYPYQPDNKTYWPFGPSQLTLQGRLKMFNLGIRIRALYKGFLDEYYNNENFKAFSTEIERTMMSADLFLAGLFPPKGFQLWNDKLEWQPIPVYRNEWDHSDDADTLCPRYKQHMRLNLAKYELENGPNNTIFLESIQSDTGIEIKDNITGTPIYLLSDCLMSAIDEGLPLPVWAQIVYPHVLSQRIKLLSYFGSFVGLKYMEGPLFQKIIELMEDKLNGKTDKQMHYYSGHDKTIFGLQSILGIPFTEFVNTGSSLILELHEDSKTRRHFVEVVYIDGSTNDFNLSTMNIRGCEHPCDFYLMKNLTKGFCGFTDYIKDCQINVSSM